MYFYVVKIGQISVGTYAQISKVSKNCLGSLSFIIWFSAKQLYNYRGDASSIWLTYFRTHVDLESHIPMMFPNGRHISQPDTTVKLWPLVMETDSYLVANPLGSLVQAYFKLMSRMISFVDFVQCTSSCHYES